jgi:hypothetical protein
MIREFVGREQFALDCAIRHPVLAVRDSLQSSTEIRVRCAQFASLKASATADLSVQPMQLCRSFSAETRDLASVAVLTRRDASGRPRHFMFLLFAQVG